MHMRKRDFDKIKASPSWAFNQDRSTNKWTHGYHRYPAKFLPNVVEKLIDLYHPQEGGMIADLFAGCGTTLVEAKAHGYASVGTDINPVATLITRVKTIPIDPVKLEAEYNAFVAKFAMYNSEAFIDMPTHKRLDYWFVSENKYKVAFLYQCANDEKDNKIREFFLVAISHILKNCSKWLQSSTKPQIDPKKPVVDPFESFKQHCQQMMQSDKLFYEYLQAHNFIDVPCEIKEGDARHTGIEGASIDTIITSPPYVTSYEYADIHQLTGYWMELFDDLSKFRQKFIGTSYSGKTSLEVSGSKLATDIIKALDEKSHLIARNVATYFNDLKQVAEEMARILKDGGYACVVIGNTTIKEVQIKSAEVFFDFLRGAGLKEKKIIKRNIPYKLMPTLRDKNTGRFTTLDNKDCKRVYPNEYIIIVQK